VDDDVWDDCQGATVEEPDDTKSAQRKSTVRRESGGGRALLNRGRHVYRRKAKMAEGSARAFKQGEGGGGCLGDSRTHERRSQVAVRQRGTGWDGSLGSSFE
jgi:hypothetical protein